MFLWTAPALAFLTVSRYMLCIRHLQDEALWTRFDSRSNSSLAKEVSPNTYYQLGNDTYTNMPRLASLSPPEQLDGRSGRCPPT